MQSIARYRSLDVNGVPGLTADYSIDGFPEYATALNSDQKVIVKQVAQRLIHSLRTDQPVRAVAIVGNCDVALKKPAGAQRTAFEQEVSDARAAIGLDVLVDQVAKLGGDAAPGLFEFWAVGIGSANRVVINPVTETQMRRNRRVDFVLFNDTVATARCAV